MDFTGAFSGENLNMQVLVLERKSGNDDWVWCSVFDNMTDLHRVARRHPESQFRIVSLPINDDVLGVRNLYSIAQ